MTFSRGTRRRSVKQPERAGVNNWLGTCFGGVKLKLDVENFPSNFRPGRVSPEISRYAYYYEYRHRRRSRTVMLPSSPFTSIAVWTDLHRPRPPSVWYSTNVLFVFFHRRAERPITRKMEFEPVVRFCTRIDTRAFKSCRTFSFRLVLSNRSLLSRSPNIVGIV